MAHIVIIGNGIAGVTCARYIRKNSSDDITIISSETEHFYARTALMYVYMGHMRFQDTKPYEDWFWEKNRLQLRRGTVTRINATDKQILLEDGTILPYDKLVIASGSSSNMPDWADPKLKGVQGLYNYADLQTMEEHTKNIRYAVVAGGGLIGIEMVEMLLSRNIHVTLLIREKYYWNSVLPDEEAQMLNRHIKEHKIELRTETEITKLISDEHQVVKGVKTKSGEEIPCSFVGITVGVHPNIAFLENSSIETDKGVLINEYFETSEAGIYAIGDCVQFREPLKGRKALEQIWYTGRMHGETLGQTLSGKRTSYKPSAMFNSAKFLDIEYQTYGYVPAKMEDDADSFYWENPGGEICFRIVFDKKTKTLTGIHGFGIRLRHKVADRWLVKGIGIHEIMAQLNDLFFDPEFYTKHQDKILEAYNLRFNSNIQSQSKSWKRMLGLRT